MTKAHKQAKSEQAILKAIGLGEQIEAIELTVVDPNYIENEDPEYSYLEESYGITEPE